jgi:uncharacterized protein (DUF2235 family)
MRACILWILVVVILASCASSPSQSTANEPSLQSEVHPLAGDPTAPKRIFVFLDGTKNDSDSKTNVWRLFKAVSVAGDPQTTAIYLTGVGSAADPLLIEQALGKEMQRRILRGYRFIAQFHRPGDQVFIFGFSRGAHQARSLAGMLAYAGVPAPISQSSTHSEVSAELAEDILEIVKKQEDDQYVSQWARWEPGMSPPLGVTIGQRISTSMVPVDIQFLGVWDTVPGSSLKEYGECKEEIGFLKTYFWWLIPGIDKGERYKVDSYPVIRRISHAVSADEKRSKFRQLLICDPLPTKSPTVVRQMQFPGAHADVGGGYEDSSDLPGISLNWMVTELFDVYKPSREFEKFQENALGLAHWSIGDSPANKFSTCVDRKLNGIQTHPSLDTRLKAAKAPLRINGAVQFDAPYPMFCTS